MDHSMDAWRSRQDLMESDYCTSERKTSRYPSIYLTVTAVTVGHVPIILHLRGLTILADIELLQEAYPAPEITIFM